MITSRKTLTINPTNSTIIALNKRLRDDTMRDDAIWLLFEAQCMIHFQDKYVLDDYPRFLKGIHRFIDLVLNLSR